MLNTSDEKIKQMLESILYPTLSYRSVEKDYYDAQNLNPEICKACGGECCQRCGCNFSPDDFKEISLEFLRQEMEKGYISIDYVDGEMILENFGIYILRTRNQGKPIVDLGYQRTPCILWTKENGCKLDYERRPSGGRLLIPSEKKRRGLFGIERQCYSYYTTHHCCYEWKPHQRVLCQLIEYFKDKDFPCSL